VLQWQRLTGSLACISEGAMLTPTLGEHNVQLVAIMNTGQKWIVGITSHEQFGLPDLTLKTAGRSAVDATD